jgi:CRISPR-associated exonuclease Cas4
MIDRIEGGEVPLSALEHYAYCHRQAALIHVDNVWTESAETLRGDISHGAVDLPGVSRKAGTTIVRSLPVWSDVHGLCGICDIVEFTGSVAAPVEYKVGKHVPGGPAELQVGGQALCLIEAGFQVSTGYIYSVAERRRHAIAVTAALLESVVAATVAIRQVLASQSLPAARNDARCRRCSLRDDCLPEVTRRPAAVAADLFTPRPLGQWHD